MGGAAPWSKLGLTVLLTSVALQGQDPSSTTEIPLEHCDVLPVVTVLTGGQEMRFLVDTAATSMLNLKSFATGTLKEVEVSSWTGTTATSAREVTLKELVLGNYRVRGLRLPAIDLSPIGKACGGQIDGILGIDLLDRLGATIDLKQQIALFDVGGAKASDDTPLEEFLAVQQDCIAAFNRADAAFFENCIDPEVVLFTPWGEVEGRQQMLDYLQRRYFSRDPPARIEFHSRDLRLLGDAVWYGYAYTITLPNGLVEGRGMAICRKSAGRWRLLNMHNSMVHPEQP